MISDGEFIVLIPFMKKDKQKAVDQCANETIVHSKNSDECCTSNFAESAWSDMMQDLSSLRERETDGNEIFHPVDVEGTGSSVRNEVDGRDSESLFDEVILFLNMLQLCDSDEIDVNSCGKFMQLLESVNCLSDPKSRICMFRNTSTQFREMEVDCAADSSCSCMCPSWLNDLLKAFYFLNIYYAFLQVQQRHVTVFSLEGGLNQLTKFGLGFDYSDLENLSLICPKVTRLIVESVQVITRLQILTISTIEL